MLRMSIVHWAKKPTELCSDIGFNLVDTQQSSAELMVLRDLGLTPCVSQTAEAHEHADVCIIRHTLVNISATALERVLCQARASHVKPRLAGYGMHAEGEQSYKHMTAVTTLGWAGEAQT